MGTKILALHGFTGSGQDFAPLAQRIPFHLTAPDLPGHTPDFQGPDAPSAFTDAVDELAGLIEAPVVIWGYSMGGRFGLSLALRHPGRVRGLILIGASPGLEDPQERRARQARDRALAQRIRSKGTPAFLEEWRRQPLISSQDAIDAKIRAPMDARRALHRAEGLAYSLEVHGTGSMPSYWRRLKELACPTLAIFGEDDIKFANIARQMHTRQPLISPTSIEGAGHCAHLENMDAFLSIVRDFHAGLS